MAIKLTNSFQIVAELTYKVTSNTTGYTRLYLKYSDRNINELTDIVYYEIRQYAYNPYGNYLAWGNANSTPWHIKSTNGTVYASDTYTQPNIYSNSGEVVRASGNFTIKHNEDGSWSDTIDFSAYVYTASLNVNVDISLPNIDRLATITNYPTSLTDEDTTITFSYSNPANFKVKVYAMVTQESAHGFAYDEYLTGSPFTWEWLSSNEDKEKLYDIVRNSPNATVSLRLQTYNNDDKFLGITAVSIPLTIVNADPFVELETEETNPKVKAVVGDDLIAINYVSQIQATATFIGSKSATLKKMSVAGVLTNESPFTALITVASEIPSTIYGVVATVEDSRGLTDGAEKNYQLVDYRPIRINTCKFKRENPTSDQIYLNSEITYWDINVKGVANSLELSYSTDGNTYITIPTSAYAIDSDNKLVTINNYRVPTKLSYKTPGRYYLKVEDRYTASIESDPITKGIPILEKGEHDVQVNGDLFIADEDRQNKVNVLEKIDSLVVDNLDNNATDKAPSQRAVNEIKSKFEVLWTGSFSPTANNTFRDMTISQNVYDYDFLLIDVSTNNSITEKTTVTLIIDGEGITCGVRGTLFYLFGSYRVSFGIYTDGYNTIGIKVQEATNYTYSEVTMNRIIGVRL